jgi:hypothetical protein
MIAVPTTDVGRLGYRISDGSHPVRQRFGSTGLAGTRKPTTTSDTSDTSETIAARERGL